MAFSDPQTLTVNSVAKTLNLIQTDGLASTYRTADGVYTLRISHQSASRNRTRRAVRVDVTKVIANPLSGANENQSYSIYQVIDEPSGNGFTDAEIKYTLAALAAWFDSTAQDKVLSDQH